MEKLRNGETFPIWAAVLNAIHRGACYPSRLPPLPPPPPHPTRTDSHARFSPQASASAS